jgi:hypothetical protein
MSEKLPIRRRGIPVAIWAIGLILAGLILCGSWISRRLQVTDHPPVITHSTPVGGTVEDGVYRSAPADADSPVTVCRI